MIGIQLKAMLPLVIGIASIAPTSGVGVGGVVGIVVADGGVVGWRVGLGVGDERSVAVFVGTAVSVTVLRVGDGVNVCKDVIGVKLTCSKMDWVGVAA